MKLYRNDRLISRHTPPPTLEAALARVFGKTTKDLTLVRNGYCWLEFERFDSRNFTLKLQTGSHESFVMLRREDRGRIAEAFREYLAGSVPAMFQDDGSLDPDCPLCAMMARQAREEHAKYF